MMTIVKRCMLRDDKEEVLDIERTTTWAALK